MMRPLISDRLLSPRFLRAYLPGLALSVLATGLCGWAAGLTLGYFLGAIALIALIAPALVAGQAGLMDRALAAAGVADGVGVALLVAVFTPALGLWQWVQVYLLAVVWAAMLGALVHLLIHLRVQRWGAAALVLLVGMLWLLWPVWLAPVLTQAWADRLTPCHPLMAINGLLDHLGLWSEQAGVAYHLTNLNQDIPHRLPESPWPAIAAHAIVASMLVLLSRLLPGAEMRAASSME